MRYGCCYHKLTGKGGLGACDHTCEGDSTLFGGGGHYKGPVYQMHDCRTATYTPLNPSASSPLKIEFTQKDGLASTQEGARCLPTARTWRPP